MVFSLTSKTNAQSQQTDSVYTYKNGSYDGIGKWYKGREIAYVMGYQGIGWLERSEREKEENVSQLILNMNIQPSDVIADIGAGSGYHSFRMAKLANKGLIYAVDIQEEMLLSIERSKSNGKVDNIETVLGSEKSINLPANAVDKVLMVDVYHEFSFPVEMVNTIKKALKPSGEIYLIEYRAEDPKVPIKPLHKMSEKQAVKEMEAAGFKLKENIANLPWQHCMIFVKKS
jgi:ubiquinone/menaquinone biosynthesis C-methylase UbiE